MSKSLIDPLILALLSCGLLACSDPCTRVRVSPPLTAAADTDDTDTAPLLSVEAPATSAAAILPGGSRYHLVVRNPRDLALLVLGPDGHFAGRIRIRAPLGLPGQLAADIQIDDFPQPDAHVDAVTYPGGVRGHARFGDHAASWQVCAAADGTLAGQRWQRHRPRPADLSSLNQAQAIGADLAALLDDALERGALDPLAARELTDLVALATLALDLSTRTFEGHGRAQLPQLSTLARAQD